MAGRYLGHTDICFRGMELSEAQKARRKSEDKINDCGNLSHNTANDFQWSINTSMALFSSSSSSKKRKGVEAKFGCLW
jgi:hypothetical protein